MCTFVVDLPVSVDVGFADHFVDLLVGEFLAEVGHDVPQLGGRDEPVAVLVEHAERLTDLLFRVRVLHLARHHRQELREVDRPVACSRRTSGRRILIKGCSPPPTKLPLSLWDPGHHLIHGSFGPPESTPQAASRSVQAFLYRADGCVQQTDRQTDYTEHQ